MLCSHKLVYWSETEKPNIASESATLILTTLLAPFPLEWACEKPQ